MTTTRQVVRLHQRGAHCWRVEREGSCGEGVALAVAQLPPLRAARQDVINVLMTQGRRLNSPPFLAPDWENTP